MKKLLKSALKYAQELNEKKVDITEDFPDWRIVGLSFANSFGEEGRAIFHLVTSANPEDYDKEETDEMFSECLESNRKRDPELPRVTAATFVMMAKKALRKAEEVDPNGEDVNESYEVN